LHYLHGALRLLKRDEFLLTGEIRSDIFARLCLFLSAKHGHPVRSDSELGEIADLSTKGTTHLHGLVAMLCFRFIDIERIHLLVDGLIDITMIEEVKVVISSDVLFGVSSSAFV